MWNYVIDVKNTLLHRVDTMEQTHWMVLGAAIVIIGVICMRGFGSAKAY